MNDRELFNKIKELKNYKPTEDVNRLFSELVNYSINPENSINLAKKEILDLQSACSSAEAAMEKYWAKRIIQSNKPNLELRNFWYYDNYLKLTQIEWENLKSCGVNGHKHDKVMFIGSGALPLTAIFLVKYFGLKVTLVDLDFQALELSRKLVSKLGLVKNFEFVHQDVFKIDNLKDFDIVFLAALVGGNTKEKITEKVYSKIKKDSHLLCRSAYDNRVLLYKPLNLSLLNFKCEREVKTYDEVVNSIIIFKK